MKLSLGSWQLVGFSLSAKDARVGGGYGAGGVGAVFTDTATSQNTVGGGSFIDLTNANLLRIGSSTSSESFIGDISGLKIFTPGTNYISKSKWCVKNLTYEIK